MKPASLQQHHSIMKHHLTALAAASLLGASAHGSTITGDPNPAGIGYYKAITMSAADSATITNSVGAWSWEDERLFGSGETPVGWTHDSNWLALTLGSPTSLTLRLESAAGVGTAGPDLFPGFTIYSGLDNDPITAAFPEAAGEENYHTYNNRSNVLWAEDMTYFAHFEPNGTHAIEQTFLLPAGQYSIALGGNTSSTSTPGRQGYLATLTTAPEPGSAVMALIGGLALCARRRNRKRSL